MGACQAGSAGIPALLLGSLYDSLGWAQYQAPFLGGWWAAGATFPRPCLHVSCLHISSAPFSEPRVVGGDRDRTSFILALWGLALLSSKILCLCAKDFTAPVGTLLRMRGAIDIKMEQQEYNGWSKTIWDTRSFQSGMLHNWQGGRWGRKLRSSRVSS